LHLVGILFPHIIDDARSKPHQIILLLLLLLLLLFINIYYVNPIVWVTCVIPALPPTFITSSHVFIMYIFHDLSSAYQEVFGAEFLNSNTNVHILQDIVNFMWQFGGFLDKALYFCQPWICTNVRWAVDTISTLTIWNPTKNARM
jgi:hypothetical protein